MFHNLKIKKKKKKKKMMNSLLFVHLWAALS